MSCHVAKEESSHELGVSFVHPDSQEWSIQLCAETCCGGVKASPRLKHTAKPLRIQPSISAETLTIAVCTHADRAERASMVSVRTVVNMILDSGRRTSTEISYVNTLKMVVLAPSVVASQSAICFKAPSSHLRRRKIALT